MRRRSFLAQAEPTMYCPRCTRDVPAGAVSCPSCGARVTATGTWFTMTMVADWLSGKRARDAVKRLLPRNWTRPLTVLPQTRWEPDEHQLYHAELLSASLQVAYQHARLWRKVSCLLTNRRLVLRVPEGDVMQLALRDIRAVTACHHWDSLDGFSQWVAIYKVRGDFSDTRGDICLVCHNRGQSHELAAEIESAIAANRKPLTVSS
jgi:RNA polymerase subunit RPABC4/transcription elongation factor Spt4